MLLKSPKAGPKTFRQALTALTADQISRPVVIISNSVKPVLDRITKKIKASSDNPFKRSFHTEGKMFGLTFNENWCGSKAFSR